jgi:predicted RNA-binding Zn-ribbon protein involved in translation (DUF1610 family)
MEPLTMNKKTSLWTCNSCGTTIPKKDTYLSGYPNSNHGLHIHCPKCGKLVAAFVNPKETQ